MELKERLINAITNGEVMEIEYYGGSNPGIKRYVAPIKIEGEKLIARCLKSNSIKSFLIEKISFNDMDKKFEVSLEVKEKINNKFISVNEFYNEYKSNLTSLGWLVKLDNDESLKLCSYFRNGSPKKSPEISLVFEEYSIESVYDIDKDIFVDHKSKKQRPWSLRAKGELTRSYANIGNAIENFLIVAEKLSPRKF